jgi:multicomponent K+:H+ antiporter subunit A
MTLPLLLLLPFLAAGLLHLLPARRSHLLAGIALAALALASACALVMADAAATGSVTRFSLPWIPEAGVFFDLRADGLASGMALLVCLIAFLVVAYAHGYQRGRPEEGQRLLVWLLAFTGAMLGLVLAGDLILLVVFWELTSLASFVLVNFKSREADARNGARITLLVTGSGGLVLLAGAVLLGQIAGTFELDALLAPDAQLRARIHGHPLFPLVVAAFIMAALTKSAQFPFHFWLARAMAAPTPVSAFLHSATLVKAGIFLLARMQPVLADDIVWPTLLVGAGGLSFVVGAWSAFRQTDLKALLAGSTVSHLGLIVLLLGLDTPEATRAALAHLLAHAVFKACAFMVAGSIDRAAGSRDLRRLGGLAWRMPITFVVASVTVPAMAGIPPFTGFITKELFLEAGLMRASEPIGLLPGHWVTVFSLLGAVLGVAYGWRLWWLPFLGRGISATSSARDPSAWLLLPMACCAVWTLAAGLYPAALFEPWLSLLLTTPGSPPPHLHLALWHGVNLTLMVSVLAIAVGSLLFAIHRPVPAGVVITERLFTAMAQTLQSSAAAASRCAWAPRLGPSLQAIAWLTLVLLLPPLLLLPRAGLAAVSAPPPLAGLLWAIAVGAALATLLARNNRLLAILLLAVVGVVLSLTFVHFSAPDLALTQILVELVGTLLLMLALHYLPATVTASPDARLFWRIGVAGGLGLAVTLAVAHVLGTPSSSFAPWFLDHSLVDAGGSNVVNVIIVDFRGFDTLGEITVLGGAALVVAALLARAGVRAGLRSYQLAGAEFPLLLAVMSRTLIPIALLISMHLFLRGHNLPGGGFIAGLVVAVGLALLQMGRGTAWLEQRLPVQGDWLLAVGLGIAALTGVAALGFGRPFLTSAHTHAHLPLFGDLPIASATLFDFGVYLVVIGAVTLILERIGGAADRDGNNGVAA